MNKFVPVTADNIIETLPYFGASSGKICDDTAGVTYQWRKLFKTDVLIHGGYLVTRSYYPQVGMCYSYPVGEGDMEEVLSLLRDDAKRQRQPFRFACVTEERLAALRLVYGKNIKAEEKRSWADYIYEPSGFQYSGKKFHTQKNHVNRFYKEHPEARLIPLSESNMEDASRFLDVILQIKPDMPDWEKGELEGTRDLIFMHGELHQIGAYMQTDKGIAAFAMGEIRDDTLYIHAEKANTNFAGAYPAMAQAFAAYAAQNVLYINREDDADDPGIRFSKEQYRPLRLIPKYLVTVEDI